jgi:hypothetical protein
MRGFLHKAAWCFFAVLLGAASLPAQKAEDIIKRHVKAIGGEKALKTIQSVRLEGTVTVDGENHAFLWQTRKPDLFYVEVQTPQGAFIEAYNGRSGWREEPASGPQTLPATEQGRARTTALFRNDRFLTYKKEKIHARLLGREPFGERAVFVIEMTTRAGLHRRLYFDAQSYLLLREVQERSAEAGARAWEEVAYGDYRPVDGVLEPFRVTIHRTVAGSTVQSWDARVERAAHNTVADPQAFQFPARAAALPDFVALLKEVEQNQKNLEKVREDYTYTMVQSDFEVDDKGNVREKSERTYEVFYLGDWQVQKLVAENGHPLPADKARKEDERIEKVIRDFHKAKQKEEQDRIKKEQRKAQGKGTQEEDDDDITVSDFLRICRLVNPRRERFRGQDVAVFEFEPRPGYKAHNRSESLIQKMTGTIWIDEQAKEIARLEARLLDSFKVGAGILFSVGRGSAFVFEQEKVRNEVWLPSYAEFNASARILFKGLKLNTVRRFSDYKKFNVEARIGVQPPKAPPQ